MNDVPAPSGDDDPYRTPPSRRTAPPEEDRDRDAASLRRDGPAPQGRLERLNRLGVLLDESIRIPGTGYRIGYDALIGLIPGVGDIAGLMLSSYIVFEAARFRLPKSTLIRMMVNIAIEAAVGAVPVAGDLFDAVYKANLKNLDLLHRRLDDSDRPPTGDRFVLSLIVLVPLAVIVALVAAIVYLISLL